MSPSPVRVDRIRPQDWRAWRAIRLEALEDTPIGFLTQLAEAERWPDEVWQERAASAAEGDSSGLWLAWDGERPIGCTGAMRDEQGVAALLIAVYVTPSARGGDVFDRLTAAVEQWARSLSGVTELRLEVHEDNARARRAYAKRGFTETGQTAPYGPDPTRSELMMVRPL